MADIPEVLPGYCTEITFQKKKSDRVSLFVDGEFLDGFYLDVIRDADIHKGDIITEETYLQLMKQECRFRLRDQFYRWLAVRNHSAGEIKKKCFAKGYDSSEINAVIEEFVNRKLLDDSLFARQFAKEKAGSKAWGPVKIRMALSQKGIKKSYIDAALQDLFPESDVVDQLMKAAASAKKRLLRTDPGIKRKKKLTDFLLRRGFPGHLVFEKVEYVLKKLENEDAQY